MINKIFGVEMKTKLQSIVGLVLFLIAGSAFAQSITVPTVSVAIGDTAAVTLGFVAGGNTTNFDFTMAYDETVVDETAIVVDCAAAIATGLTTMSCAVDTATNTVKGIGVNFTPNLLTSADFATVSLPVLSGASSGDSTNAFDINFSASGVVTTVNTTWTLTVLAAMAADQTITGFAAVPDPGVFGGTSTLSATASSGLAVTFGSNTSAICTIDMDGITVNYLAAGVCQVTADQAGDAAFNAAPQVTLDIVVAKADQTIDGFAANPTTGTLNGTSALSATASSGLLVDFGSSTPSVCTVVGTTVTFNSGGTCTVTADQAGDDDYNPATQVTLDIGVDKTDQTITGLAADPAAGVVDGTSALSATADSGLPVAFGSSTPAECSVIGSTVTYLATGTCTVTADQAGDDDFNAALQVTLDITVAIGDQVITDFVANPGFGFLGSTSTLSATGGGSVEPVIFASNTAAICSVVGSTVTYLAVGTCTVTADQAGDANYNDAPQVTLDINVTEFSPISEPIPTLSQWSLVLLFLALLSMGGIVIRRKDVG